jgi:hypothetical protein
MWTYTGTVAFSAPEVFSGGFYKYEFCWILANKLISGAQDAFFTQCWVASCHLMLICTYFWIMQFKRLNW